MRKMCGWLIVLGLLAACACNETPTGRASDNVSPDNVIPWINSPGTAPVPAGQGQPSRPCRAADLVFTVRGHGVAAGMGVQDLDVRNQSSDGCYMANVRIQRVNETQPIVVGSGKLFSDPAGRLNVAAGETIHMSIGGSDDPGACPAIAQHPQQFSSALRLTLDTGEVVPVEAVRIPATCPPSVVKVVSALPTPSPGPQSMLEASWSAPQTANRGSTLTYQVKLTDPTSTAITLSPCPSYTQTLSSPQGGTPIVQTFLLNCASAAAVPANGSLTYEMKLVVRSDFATGPAKLTWQLYVPNGNVSAGGAIQIK